MKVIKIKQILFSYNNQMNNNVPGLEWASQETAAHHTNA